MCSIDWFLNLLEGDLESAEREILKDVDMKDARSLVNLLAVKLLKNKYRDVIRLTNEYLVDDIVVDDNAIRVMEYRILADISLGDIEDIVRCLYMVRIPLLTFNVDYYPVFAISTINQLLDEQTTIFFRRRYRSVSNTIKLVPFSNIVCVALYNAYKESKFDKLPPPRRALMLALLSVVYSSIPRQHTAILFAKKAVEIHDGYIQRTALGKIYLALNNLNKAFNELQRALNYSTTDKLGAYEARINLAQLYLIRGDYSLALDMITRALRIRQDPISRLIRGEALLNLGKLNEAIVAFKALANVNDKQIKIRALLNLSICYFEKKSYRRAFDYLWMAHMLDPNNKYISLLANIMKVYGHKG